MAPRQLQLLLLASLSAVAHATESFVTCTTEAECCELCGVDSYRCARGPCSTNFLTEDFFSFSLPTKSVGFWDVIFSWYSTVPYLVLIAVAVDFIFRKRSWTRLLAFAYILILTIINTVVIVKLLGDCSECPRPCGSCVHSNGMPSGHATNAIGMATWIILETIRGFGSAWSTTRKAITLCITVLVLVPVPYSRVYLGDHTALQVTIGSVDGLVLGIIFFFVFRYVVSRRLDSVSRFVERNCWGFVIQNDYSHPQHASPSIELSLLEVEEQK